MEEDNNIFIMEIHIKESMSMVCLKVLDCMFGMMEASTKGILNKVLEADMEFGYQQMEKISIRDNICSIKRVAMENILG